MYCSSILKIIYIFYSFSLSSSLTLPLSQLYPHRLSLFLPLPFLSLNVVCSNGFDVASMGLFRCGCGLLRSVYHGSSGGSAWWAVGYGFWIWVDLGIFLGIFWVDYVASTFSGYFLGWSVYHGSSSNRCGFDVFLGWSSAFFWVFSRLIMWLWCFLDIFWVDRCIMGQAPIDVASTFFWVDHRRFSGYFRQPGFQIRDVSFWSMAWVVGVVAIVGSRWFVCVWLYWWFGGLCLCVALLMVCVCVCVCVCVWLCVCGDWFA